MTFYKCIALFNDASIDHLLSQSTSKLKKDFRLFCIDKILNNDFCVEPHKLYIYIFWFYPWCFNSVVFFYIYIKKNISNPIVALLVNLTFETLCRYNIK